MIEKLRLLNLISSSEKSIDIIEKSPVNELMKRVFLRFKLHVSAIKTEVNKI